MVKRIAEFDGFYYFLSNFYSSPVEFEGYLYSSVEHAYQAAKSLDPKDRESVAKQPTPAAAKKQGRKLTLREDWNEVKIPIMEELVRKKFQDPSLKKQLLKTGSAELVEGNWWGDTFWGVCKGVGANHLGKVLMKIRGELNE